MGLPPAPQIANATLYHDEFKFQEIMTKQNYKIAKSLNHTHRFIDDISPFNDNGNFEKFRTQMYPPELVLNRENTGFQSASVMEMQINIVNNKFQVSMYDKRDGFKFEVTRYPSLKSNIPDKLLYTVFYGQLVRLSRVCNYEKGYIKDVKILVKRMKGKGAKIKLLKHTLVKFFKKYNLRYTNLKNVEKMVF